MSFRYVLAIYLKVIRHPRGVSYSIQLRKNRVRNEISVESDESFHFSGTVCEVCKRTLARRLGKQGYECRDCQMKCHKHCHVKVDITCPTSTIQSIEL